METFCTALKVKHLHPEPSSVCDPSSQCNSSLDLTPNQLSSVHTITDYSIFYLPICLLVFQKLLSYLCYMPCPF